MSRNPFDTPSASGGWQSLGTPAERDDSHIREIPAATWRERKRKDTRKRARARAILLLPRVKEGLEKWAQRLGVPRYEVTRYLLEYGLEAVGRGSISIEPRLAQDGLTLYPHEHPRRRRKAPRTVRITERGIPDVTWERLAALADVVPLWQVVNYLLEHGLNALESGQLRPRPHQSGTYTLY